MELYEVIVLGDAKQDIERITDYIINEFKNPKLAAALSIELWATIRKLDFMPFRFGIIDEPELAKREIRRIKYKEYSIFYVIDENNKKVRVIRVKHSLQDTKLFFDI